MPRGTCEHCKERDAFVHGKPLADRKVFVCARCLGDPQHLVKCANQVQKNDDADWDA